MVKSNWQKNKKGMSDEFKYFYKFLKYFGLMAVHYDSGEMCYVIKNNIIYSFYWVLIQISLIISIIIVTFYKHLYYAAELQETGNYYNRIMVQFTAALNILFNIWCISKQKKHLEILETVRNWKFKYLSHNVTKFHFHTKTRMGFFMLALMTYIINTIRILTEGVYEHFFLNLPWILYAIRLIVTSLTITIYTAILITITNILKFIQNSIEDLKLQETVTISKELQKTKFQELLEFHNKIFQMVADEMSCIYGVAILMCFIFILFEIILDVYLLAIFTSEIKFENEMKNYIYIFGYTSWMLPIIILSIVGCFCSNITEEVRI